MKESFKFIDAQSFDNEDEALSVVSVSDAQWAVKIAVIEELQKVYHYVAEHDTAFNGPYVNVKEYLFHRIEKLQSKQTKLNEIV
jgi:hypothetical protein